MVSSRKGVKPYKVQLTLEGTHVTMEVDTGASTSVISKDLYLSKFSHLDLKKTNILLKSFMEEPVKVLGSIEVAVSYNGETVTLPLLVVEVSGPSLLGRDWLQHFRLDWKQLFRLHHNELALDDILKCHKGVFNAELGLLSGYEAKIYIEEKAQPRFCRARLVPLALKPLVAKELDRLVEQGILEPVEFADWAAPIVPVLKSDKGSVHICGDFEVTINQVTKVDAYPLPKVEELIATLSGGKVFSKLDLSQAYQQVPLAKESQNLAIINTHRGLFRYTRMPFGISSAPVIFQRIMESLLQGIPGVVVYLDDILVAGSSTEEHLQRLKEVLD